MSENKKRFYSHSKLSTFEQCPMKYKFRYIDKIKPLIEQTIEAVLGTAVHNTLEWIYNSVKQQSREGRKKPPELDDIIVYYAENWKKIIKPNTLIVRREMTEKDYFDKGVQFLIGYFQNHYPFKDGTIECEKKIWIDLDEKTKIQGFIDRVVHDIEKGHYEIHDYKTANTLPTQKEKDQDRQLALYSIAIKEIYGKDKEVILVWHYLAHNQKIISRRTNEELEKLKEDTKKLIEKIESATEFPFNKSPLCDWCEYKDICPAWNPNSEHSTLIQDTNKKEQTNLDDYPIAKKYIRDKPQENPADKEGFSLGVI